MRITLFTDFRFANDPAPTGVLKHALFMARGLAANPGHQVSALVPSDQVGKVGCLSFLPQRRLPLPWSVAMPVWTAFSAPAIDPWLDGADWVYGPKNDWFPVRRARLAVTVHGASELDPAMPKASSLADRARRERRRIQYRKMCARADLILCVSNFLKTQMAEWFQADPDKLVVIGNGVDPAFYEAGARPSLAGAGAEPFILCVGGLNYLDGGDRIVALGREVRRSGRKLRIKVAGCQHDPGMEALAAQTGVIDLLGYVPHEQLSGWMARAGVFFFPTRYETFGMAAAEAMAAGAPIVTCRSTAVPEVVRDAGVYADPDDASQCLDAVAQLLDDPAARDRLIRRGKALAPAYTWDGCLSRLEQALASHL